MSTRTWIAAAVFLALAVPGFTQPVARPDVPPRATRTIPSQPPLPPLTAEAQQLIDQWKQDQASIIDQLRFLQRTYRDDGHAEDAAAVAAQVRALQQRPAPALGIATADLVNDGLPTRDEPVLMSAFRHRAGETLSFAIRGRDDQQVWGTTSTRSG